MLKFGIKYFCLGSEKKDFLDERWKVKLVLI